MLPSTLAQRWQRPWLPEGDAGGVTKYVWALQTSLSGFMYRTWQWATSTESDMTDNTEIPGPQDPKTVNLSQDWEVRHWCEEFNCTADELREAVERAGSNAVEAVRVAVATVKQDKANQRSTPGSKLKR